VKQLPPWKAQVIKQRQKDIQLYTQLMDEIKEKKARGDLPTCFAKHLLEEQENLGMSDLEIAYAAGSPFGAGVETVSSHLSHTNNVEKGGSY
jgi:cytochrome P450